MKYGQQVPHRNPETIIDGRIQMQAQMLPDTSSSRKVFSMPRRNNWMSSTVFMGKIEGYNHACNFLIEKEVGMIGTYGMGGVVRKQFLDPLNFKVIWIIVFKMVDANSKSWWRPWICLSPYILINEPKK